jgi:hypothetical protein
MVLAYRQSDRSVPGLQRNSERMRETKRGLTGRQRYSDVGGGRLIKVITKPQLVTLSHREGGKNKESKHPGASIPHLGRMEDVEWSAEGYVGRKIPTHSNVKFLYYRKQLSTPLHQVIQQLHSNLQIRPFK